MRLALLALLSLTSLAHAADLRAIAEIPAINTYRIVASYRMGDHPPLQLTEIAGAYSKSPARHELRILVTEGGRDPVTIETRQVGGRIYASYGGQWAEVDKFQADELIVLSPDQLISNADALENLGTEERNGRPATHLRGDREDLLTMERGRDGLDFARTDRATVDLWVDQEHRFILDLHITAEVEMRDGVMPVDITYAYTDLNEPVAVEIPPLPEPDPADAPPVLTQTDVTEKLGFPFPVPEGAAISIYGATVVLVTSMPLAEARAYADEAMSEAGFAAAEVVELAPNEFYTDYAKGERTLGVLVFQVAEGGATIRVGALK